MKYIISLIAYISFAFFISCNQTKYYIERPTSLKQNHVYLSDRYFMCDTVLYKPLKHIKERSIDSYYLVIQSSDSTNKQYYKSIFSQQKPILTSPSIPIETLKQAQPRTAIIRVMINKSGKIVASELLNYISPIDTTYFKNTKVNSEKYFDASKFTFADNRFIYESIVNSFNWKFDPFIVKGDTVIWFASIPLNFKTK